MVWKIEVEIKGGVEAKAAKLASVFIWDLCFLARHDDVAATVCAGSEEAQRMQIRSPHTTRQSSKRRAIRKGFLNVLILL